MKVNNYYSAVGLVIYDQNKENKKLMNPYTARAYYNSVDILGDTYRTYDDYFCFIIDNLFIAKRNQIETSKRKKHAFFVCESGTIQGVLYLPISYVEKWTKEERRSEHKQGCVSVSYDDVILFNKNIIEVRESFHEFKKGSDPINNKYREDIHSIDEEIKNLKEKHSYFEKSEKHQERRRRLIAFYESKKAAGYEYSCWCYRALLKRTREVVFMNCVDHYEKTPEFVKVEKLTKELQKICDRWCFDDTMQLLKDYKITKKRQKKEK